MDKIFLSDLHVQAMIGIYPDERISSRPVQIDLEFGVPGKRVFRSGDVADTIDYAAVSERIRDEVARVRFGLESYVLGHEIRLYRYRPSLAPHSLSKLFTEEQHVSNP